MERKGEDFAGKLLAIGSFFGSIAMSFVNESKVMYVLVAALCILGIAACTKFFKHGLIIGILSAILTIFIVVIGRNEVPVIFNSADKEIFDLAVEYIEKENYEMSIKTFNDLSEKYIERDEVKEKYNYAKQKYKEKIFSEASILAGEEKYTEALSKLEYAKDILKDDLEISDKIEEVEALEITKEAKDHISNGEYETAIAYLNNKKENGVQESVIARLLDEAKEAYKTDAISQAKTFISDKNYDAAENILNKALELLEEDTEIKAVLLSIDEKRPLDLTSLEARKLGNCLDLDFRNDYKDDYGNTYSGNALSGDKFTYMDPFSFGNSFFINGKYKYLKATVTILENCNNGSIKFYNGEDKIKEYEIDIVYDQPYEISVEIDNINLLGIVIEGAVLVNPTLYSE